jgi:hypothetical protein
MVLFSRYSRCFIKTTVLLQNHLKVLTLLKPNQLFACNVTRPVRKLKYELAL